MLRSAIPLGLTTLTGILALQFACSPPADCVSKDRDIDMARHPDLAPFPLDEAWQGTRTMSGTWWDGEEAAFELTVTLDPSETWYRFKRPRPLSGVPRSACLDETWNIPARIDGRVDGGRRFDSTQAWNSSQRFQVMKSGTQAAEPASTEYRVFLWGRDWSDRFDELMDRFDILDPERAEFEVAFTWHPDGRVEGRVVLRDQSFPPVDSAGNVLEDTSDTGDLVDTMPGTPEWTILTF